MRRGIIGKIKDTLSKTPKVPELIKVNISNEKLNDFNVKIIDYEKEANKFNINNKELMFDINIRNFEKKSEIKILNQEFSINDVSASSINIDQIETVVKAGGNITFESKIKDEKVTLFDLKIKESYEESQANIRDGIELICGISKTYYSEISLAKEKIREIGVKIKKKYPEISFKEYGIKYIFTEIPYRSIEKFNYNDKKGSLQVFYKKSFIESELINFVVLKNINSNALKKIFI